MTRSRLALAVAIVALIAAYFVFDLGRYFSLDFFKSQQAAIDAYFHANPVQTAAIYFAVYVVVTALSLPGAALMTLAGGAIFGLLSGLVLVSFASSIGATLAFLASRFLFRDPVQKKFGDKLAAVNRGVEREGAFYLFTLRLVPLFPFFVINLVMGLTPMKTRTFYWVSQLGMLAGTLVYVYAGTQIARIDSLKGILSPGLVLAFAALGLFPLVAKKAVDAVRARRVYAKWPRPSSFDRNMVVIGAGSAGLVSS
ncbi:MAG: TVP38/TMEM64 family protein, partial [Burkholderiales bacterium]|nr:TVP38/TMEM64 family protein [Burkholderiales bacterium]